MFISILLLRFINFLLWISGFVLVVYAIFGKITIDNVESSFLNHMITGFLGLLCMILSVYLDFVELKLYKNIK